MWTTVRALRMTGTTDRDAMPSDRFEAQCLRGYVANAVGRPLRDPRSRATADLLDWVRDHSRWLGLPDAVEEEAETSFDGYLSTDDSRRFAQLLATSRQKAATPPPSSLENRLHWIAATLGLSELDAAILKLATRAVLLGPVQSLANAAAGEKAEDEIGWDAVALLLGRPTRAIRARLRAGKPLLQLGLLEDRNGGDFTPSRTVLRLARLRRRDPEHLRSELLGKSPRGTLTWKDFDHLGTARDLVARLLAAAFERGEQGIGILLHGAPGTGKTEFAKTLAAKLSASAVFIGEADDANSEPTRSERISHFALASAVAARAGRAILVVDEADDLFTGVDEDDRASRIGSKVFMNRLVERCPAPTIWITNSPARLGPAVMRRMAFAVRFREPGRQIRRRMVERLVKKRRLDFRSDELDSLAALNAAPALLDAGLRTAALTGGGSAAALTGATSLLDALGRRAPVASISGAVLFDPALSAADCDLVALAERVRTSGAAGGTALSFCFHGLPGTGKSAYGRFLAERLGFEVIEKRASDLLSMWVGGTEQNIAAAFAEAADRRAMLIIDEADSLLRDRAGAQRSWEVSQVNEMLTWMERHPYPFVCTTNLMDSLDTATLRRFLFKVKFLPMTTAQAREAFRRAFGADASQSLDRLDLLTPGDFMVVARKAKVLGEKNAAVIMGMLETEVAAKPGAQRKRIGF